MKQYYLGKIKKSLNCTKFLLGLCVLGVVFCCFGGGTAMAVTYSTTHIFSIDDVQGGFDGSTFGAEGLIQVPAIICGTAGSYDTTCPGDAQPVLDTSGTTLYPVDSEFGFIVEDFVGAAQKTRNRDYAEGWVGNEMSNGELVGIRVSNAATDSFKVPYPLGNWCAGLGGNKVKCCSEHYVVMEHVKTCNETNPYYFYDFGDENEPGHQRLLIDPDTGVPLTGDLEGLTCEEGKLDNVLKLIVNGVKTETLLTPDPITGNPVMIANESYVLNDIAAGNDYSITKKDDGKALYRFGSMIKRPNDIRLYARMELPQEWKDNPDTIYKVNRAELHVDHLITNNPNDQIRPEDMENEGATGRLPTYIPIDNGEAWISNIDCYEGDGDFIAAGTLYKDSNYNIPVNTMLDDLVPYSEDLQEGFTNAWYTTTDRDPFEPDTVSGIGPRWRLKANKFGQDLPGLEIPKVDAGKCMPTPYTSKFKKYEVGEATTTVINLLDIEEGITSPLLTSSGWMSGVVNEVNELAPLLDEYGEIVCLIDEDPCTHDNIVWNENLSINGLPLTDDFDLAVYVKGDRKSTVVYNATLIIDYGDTTVDPPIPDGEFDLAIDNFRVPRKIVEGDTKKIRTYVSNTGPDVASGLLHFIAVLEEYGTVFDEFFVNTGEVAPGDIVKVITPWLAPATDTNVSLGWTVTLEADGDNNLINNDATGTMLVKAINEFDL